MGCPFCGNALCGGGCNQAYLAKYASAMGMQNVLSGGGLGQWQAQQALASQLAQVSSVRQEPLPKMGMKVEDLIGWRIWRVSPSGLLMSFSQANLWLPLEPMKGEPGDHDSAGIWAFHSETLAAAKLAGSVNHVMGQVRMWGHVIKHEQGFRSQFARIVSIDAISLAGKFPWDDDVERALSWLRRRYGLTAS